VIANPTATAPPITLLRIIAVVVLTPATIHGERWRALTLA
jgi:hypothetical protein